MAKINNNENLNKNAFDENEEANILAILDDIDDYEDLTVKEFDQNDDELTADEQSVSNEQAKLDELFVWAQENAPIPHRNLDEEGAEPDGTVTDDAANNAKSKKRGAIATIGGIAAAGAAAALLIASVFTYGQVAPANAIDMSGDAENVITNIHDDNDDKAFINVSDKQLGSIGDGKIVIARNVGYLGEINTKPAVDEEVASQDAPIDDEVAIDDVYYEPVVYDEAVAEPEPVYEVQEVEPVVESEPELVVVDPNAPKHVWASIPFGGYDWFASCEDFVDFLQRDGGYHWYIAHNSTSYGQAIADLWLGDVVEVDGVRWRVVDKFISSWTYTTGDVYEQVGPDKTIFQTCYDFTSDRIWIVSAERI